MSTFIERMKEEHEQVNQRFQKLVEFMVTPTFADMPKHDRWLLAKQRGIMHDYIEILATRISVAETR